MRKWIGALILAAGLAACGQMASQDAGTAKDEAPAAEEAPAESPSAPQPYSPPQD
jgi:ABC-type glycerol-3-phosphate transport system substrate-binding protein